MKYAAILFDYGSTLGYVADKTKFLEMPIEIQNKLGQLRKQGYLLGILSNSNQESDAQHMRRKLQKYGILDLFEATMWVPKDKPQKPELIVFHRLAHFVGVEPSQCLFVGDSKHCDGACVNLGMDFLHVNLDEQMWLGKLDEQLQEEVLFL